MHAPRDVIVGARHHAGPRRRDGERREAASSSASDSPADSDRGRGDQIQGASPAAAPDVGGGSQKRARSEVLVVGIIARVLCIIPVVKEAIYPFLNEVDSFANESVLRTCEGGLTCLLVEKIDRTPTKVFTFLLIGAVAQRAPDNLKRS